MNEVVIFNVKFADVPEDVVHVLAIGPCSTLLGPDIHILEIFARTIRELTDCQAVLSCLLKLLGVKQHDATIAGVWYRKDGLNAGVEDCSGLPTVPLYN